MNREDVLDKNLKEFPDTPTLTLAKKIYKEHPELFTIKGYDNLFNLLV